jgi:hypothetical protein
MNVWSALLKPESMGSADGISPMGGIGPSMAPGHGTDFEANWAGELLIGHEPVDC